MNGQTSQAPQWDIGRAGPGGIGRFLENGNKGWKWNEPWGGDCMGNNMSITTANPVRFTVWLIIAKKLVDGDFPAVMDPGALMANFDGQSRLDRQFRLRRCIESYCPGNNPETHSVREWRRMRSAGVSIITAPNSGFRWNVAAYGAKDFVGLIIAHILTNRLFVPKETTVSIKRYGRWMNHSHQPAPP
ncbi:hypothetical protein CDEST_13402 [Colletotrichum destructivum]|uniref:Uncharacterized protein n=1 Tax=Colletotrichum destructivum TaxID=34406 RepID=A0AAX4IYY7_9PEZI|nr:hypothetical protein CDEST_13402 [Colletotrichum destructivum]